MLEHNWLNEILLNEIIKKDRRETNENERFLENLLPKHDDQFDEHLLKQLKESLMNKKDAKSILMMNSGQKVKVTNSSTMCLLS